MNAASHFTPSIKCRYDRQINFHRRYVWRCWSRFSSSSFHFCYDFSSFFSLNFSPFASLHDECERWDSARSKTKTIKNGTTFFQIRMVCPVCVRADTDQKKTRRTNKRIYDLLSKHRLEPNDFWIICTLNFAFVCFVTWLTISAFEWLFAKNFWMIAFRTVSKVLFLCQNRTRKNETKQT